MDRLDYEINITDTIDQACGRLNEKDFDKLLDRLKEYIKEYEEV